MRELKTGILRIGTSKAYARYIMPFLISTYHQAYPEIKILLNEGSSLEVINRLFSFDNEVAMVAKAEDNPLVHFIPFSREEIVLIAAPSHDLSKKRSVSIDELIETPIIMKEVGSATRKAVEELFARHDRSPSILMETSNTEFIKQLVEQGDGVAFLIRETVFAAIADKRLVAVPLKQEKVHLEVGIGHIKGQPISPPAQAFLDMIEKMAGGCMPVDGIGTLMPHRSATLK
jgi:DNA-binding transcriptional LysR family regulator